jgi:tetratricopeptide (TPR) repeat protein
MKFYLSLCFLSIVNFCNAQNDSAVFYYNVAKQANSEKKYLLAEKNYIKSLTFDATNVSYKTELAMVSLLMKKNTAAINYFKEIEKIEPNNTIAIANLSTLSFTNFKWEDAIVYAKKCLELKIGEKSNYIIAKSYHKLEDYKNSSTYLKAAAIDDPKNADIPYTMANIWQNSNNAQRAIDMYEVAISLDTSKAAWILELAEIHNQMGNFNKATECYERALAKGTTSDLSLQTTIGLAYLNGGEYKKGVEVLEKVIIKKPMDRGLYTDMAYAFYEAKKYSDAIKWWDEVLKIDKNDYKTLYMIGVAFQKDGQDAKGKKICDIAIGKDPSLSSLKKEMPMPGGMGL